MTELLPDRDRLGYYRRAVLRAQVEATPLDPMGRHRCCPFCRSPLDHHHEGRPRLYDVALQSASEIEAVWRAVAGCLTDARTLAACGLVAQFRDGDHWRILHLEEATRRAKYRESRRLAGEASAAARRRRAGTAKPGAKP